eukprot:72225-Pelagomonas_calceolata.AAC.5
MIVAAVPSLHFSLSSSDLASTCHLVFARAFQPQLSSDQIMNPELTSTRAHCSWPCKHMPPCSCMYASASAFLSMQAPESTPPD